MFSPTEMESPFYCKLFKIVTVLIAIVKIVEI